MTFTQDIFFSRLFILPPPLFFDLFIETQANNNEMDQEDHTASCERTMHERLQRALQTILEVPDCIEAEDLARKTLTGSQAIKEQELSHVVDTAIIEGAQSGLPVERICAYASAKWIDNDSDDTDIQSLVASTRPPRAFRCLQLIYEGLARRFVVFEEDVKPEANALWAINGSYVHSWLLNPKMRDFAILFLAQIKPPEFDVTEFSLRLVFMRLRGDAELLTRDVDGERNEITWPPAEILDHLTPSELSSDRVVDHMFRMRVGHGDWRAVDWENKSIHRYSVVSSALAPPALEVARRIMCLNLSDLPN